MFEGRGSDPAIVVPFQLRREPRFLGGRARGSSSGHAQYARRLYAAPLSPDVAFLCRHGVPEHIVRLASALAAVRGTQPTDELFANGFERSRYWSLLAEHLGLPFADNLDDGDLLARSASTTVDAVRLASSVLIRRSGRTLLAVAPQGEELAVLKDRLKDNPALADRVIIAAPETIRAFLVARRHAALTHYAVNRLARVLPRLSARDLLRSRPVRGRSIVAAICAGIGLLTPGPALNVVVVALTAFFFNCGVWKAMAAFRRPRPTRVEPLRSGRLPTYTVLVPLYREAAVLPDLVAHLAKLDYPASKLQVLFLVEADDLETREAVKRAPSLPGLEIITVPPGQPRTKPKALVYALPFARGDFVVVFDAEDRPEPDQLRKAAAAFGDSPDLGCVQARLAPDHEGSWLARMFKLEYAANFEVLLPALADAGVPLPLGGTSNHFPRAVLERVGAWDPYNVTEDADLGIRLARFGLRTVTIYSRTYEEAPLTFRQWLPQRRRWIKGWMQTALLCVSGPVPAGLRLSLRDRLAVHGLVSAGVVGLLLYPASVSTFVMGMVTVISGGVPSDLWTWLFLALNANLLVIVAAAAVSSFRGLRALGALHLAPLILLLPVYWALMAIAAWQALFQLFRDPSGWEKTAHGLASDRPPAGKG